MAAMRESQIQSIIMQNLRNRGAYIVKVIVATKTGIPDILCCYRGKFIGIEVKRPETIKTVTELQKYNIEEIKKAGGIAIVATSALDVINLLEDIDETFAASDRKS